MSGHSFNDRNGHCDNCGAYRDDCLHEEFAAINWRLRCERLYDLLHKLAPFVPRTMDELHTIVQDELDEGVAWIDGKLIECDGDK